MTQHLYRMFESMATWDLLNDMEAQRCTDSSPQVTVSMSIYIYTCMYMSVCHLLVGPPHKGGKMCVRPVWVLALSAYFVRHFLCVRSYIFASRCILIFMHA